ncbi:zinc-binding alcohol dehydrogenase family protein [Membranihabitans maritimus]|uniref:zinc-binding alcohol dehydrogenase family protein n=1 Tax=Membranihabitans maritimus TaxID=2904244 RepID=UPI001F46A3B8|nr:zinc-binding alcohol dehydrogenase family protein [Membranihabitans maritimus]
MKSITCTTPHCFEEKEKSIPGIQTGEALVKINRVGICGTDLHAFQGNQPFFRYPRILGHELSGTIVELSDNDSDFSTGDRVCIIPYIHCGQCQACRAGQTNCCQDLKVYGVHVDGGMQQYINYPMDLLLKVNTMTSDEAAIVEPLAIGAHSLRRANVQKEQLIVVQGCGPIGIGIIMLANYMGAHIVALDVNESRLQYVKNHFGVLEAFNPIDKHAQSIIKHYFEKRKADIVFDATGSAKAIPTGIQYMRHGGKLVLVGIANTDLIFNHPEIHARETSILCSRNATTEDFSTVTEAIRTKTLALDKYITKVVDQSEILSHFNKWASPDSEDIKIVTSWE